MKTIGIVSNSPEALQHIRAVADSVFKPHSTHYETYCYKNTSEIKDIILNHVANTTGWVFSGETPYYHAQPFLPQDTASVYCILNGLEFFRYLLQCLYHSPTHELRVSVDLPKRSIGDWQTALNEAHIPHDQIYICYYDSSKVDQKIHTIVTQHQQLWQQSAIDCVLTSSTKVHDLLKAQDIPVVQMHGSTFTIRNALVTLHERIMRHRLQQNQVALIRIEPTDIDRLFSAGLGSLRIQTDDLRIKEKILTLCQQFHGSYLVQKDTGRYDIFASRGIIEDNFPQIQALLDDIRLSLNMELSAGIGFGYTTFDAQRNAFHALEYCRSQTPCQPLVSIDADGTIQENIGTEKSLTFTSASTNKELLKKLDSVGVGIKNYTRIAAIAQKLNHPFTSNEIAQHMDVTNRNAHRVLANLLKADLIRCIGEEALSSRGRPTKKYQMNPEFL